MADPALTPAPVASLSLMERALCFFGLCPSPAPASGGGFVQDTSAAVNGVVDNFFGNVFRVALVAAAVLIVLGGLWIYTAGSTVQAVIPAVVPHISGIVTAGGNAGAAYLGGVGQVVQPVGQLVAQVTPTGQFAQVGGDVAGLLRAVGGGR